MKLNLKKKLTLIIILGALLRVISIIFFGDKEVSNEWGIMLENLEQNQVLSVRSVNGVPVPNIFMPPLYPLFLYVIKLGFNEIHIFLNSVFICQLIFSLISIFLVYKILKELFNDDINIFGTLVYSIFPINVFAVSQISSISLQTFLINVFLFGFIKLFKSQSLKNISLFSFSSALSIILITSLISPYLYRNYNIFGEVTITKSFGYNLLKGNHPETVVEGVGMFRSVEEVIPETKEKLDELYALGPIKKHDLYKDKILLDQAIIFIKENPLKYIKLYIAKFISFLFFDINSSYPNYYSLFHLLPKIVISITAVLGIVSTLSLSKNITNYFTLFYLANIGLFSFFFILPRYSLSLLTIQIILSLYFIEKKIIKYKNIKK
jgi:hypothetical protein